MKKLIIVISALLLFWGNSVYSQNIIEAEYFFDIDPGIGNATPLSITPGDSSDLKFLLPTSTLAEGFHTLHLRYKNDSTGWSMYESRTFQIQGNRIIDPDPNLLYAEYFFDSIPVNGNGIPISFTPGDSTIFLKVISSTGLSPGFHTVFIRFRNDSSLWSMYSAQQFNVQADQILFSNASLFDAEYFFNTDPGVGNGKSINIIPGDSTELITKFSTDGLSAGFHNFYIRFIDDSLNWSFYRSGNFFIQPDPIPLPPTQLIGGEYFIDNDPGLGNGTPISMSPSDSLNVQLTLGTDGIDTGYHYVYARVLSSNNIWSNYGRDTFLLRQCVYPHADFSASNVCLGDTTYFIDLSTNVDSTAVYQWDIDNDGNVDYTTVGNIAHLYTTPGIHSAKLTVLNSGLCPDEVIKSVTVLSPSVNIGTDTSICDCASITLDAGSGFTNYIWSSGQNTRKISVIPVISTLYTVTVTDNNGCSGSDDILVSTYSCPGLTLNAEVLLQGAYDNSGMMDTQINSVLPLTQPYNADPWFYNGNEILSSIPSQMVDWILVELRDMNDYTKIVDRRAGILLNNGNIINTALNGGLEFNCVVSGNYYIVIRHRNHLPVMSAIPYNMPYPDTLDFSDISNHPPFGNLQDALYEMEPGHWGLISGDVNQNYQLKYSGPGNDKGLVLQKIFNVSGSTSITTTINGYYSEDINMDGIVKYSGPGNDPSLIIQNLFTITGSTAITTVFITPVPQSSP